MSRVDANFLHYGVLDYSEKGVEMVKLCCFVICYFGKLPDYMPFFLQTCASNPEYNWLLFTDDKTQYHYPNNVCVIYTSFEELREDIQDHFDFRISLPTPKKLCDFKPAYGYLFAQYLTEYSFWGHCDLDQFFGNLQAYIPKDKLELYDKIFTLGHMTIYRNTPEISKLFMVSYHNEKAQYTSFQQIFENPIGLCFDEWPHNQVNINVLAEQEKIRICKETPMLDIVGYRSYFLSSTYNGETNEWGTQFGRQFMICFDGKDIFYVYIKDNRIIKIPAPYAHIQKRVLKIDAICNECFVIVPNRIISCNCRRLDDIQWIKKTIRCRKIRSFFRIDEIKRKRELIVSFLGYQISKFFFRGEK